MACSKDLHPAQIKKLELETDKLGIDIDNAKLERQAAKLELQARKLELEERNYIYGQKKARADRHGRYMFFGGVGANSVSECIGELQWWHRQYPDQPFEIVLNSPGGDVLHGSWELSSRPDDRSCAPPYGSQSCLAHGTARS